MLTARTTLIGEERLTSLDERKEHSRIGHATQRKLWKDDHLFCAPLASRVRGVTRVQVYLARSFVSRRS